MNCNTTHYRANSSSVPGDPTWLLGKACGAAPETIARVFFWGHLAATVALVWGLLALGAALFGPRAGLPAGLLAAALLLLGQHRALGGDDLYSAAFTHTYVAYAGAAWILAAACAGRWVWAWAGVGLLFNLHALTAVHAGVFLGGAILVEGLPLGRLRAAPAWRWQRMALGLLLAAVLAMPTLWGMLATRQTYGELWWQLMWIRSAEHSFASSWWAPGHGEVVRFALFCGLGVLGLTRGTATLTPEEKPAVAHIRRLLWGMAMAGGGLLLAGFLFTEVWPSASAVRAQLFRSSRLWLLLMFAGLAWGAVATMLRPLPHRGGRILDIATAVVVVLVVALPGLAVWLPWALLLWALVGASLGWLGWRSALLTGGLLGLVALALRTVDFPVPGLSPDATWTIHPWPWPAAAALVLAAALALLAFLLPPTRGGRFTTVLAALIGGGLGLAGLFLLAFAHVTPRADPWIDIQRWVQAHTPPDAVVLTPLQPGGFRIHSQRAVVAEWRDGTQLYFAADFAAPWWERVQALAPGLVLSNDGRRVLSRGAALETLPADELLALAQRYGATCLVLPASRPVGLVERHRNAAWVVYAPERPPVPETTLVIPPDVTDKDAWIAGEKFMQDVVAANIEKHRKSPVTLRILDATGRVVPDAAVTVRQTNSAFNFSASLPFFQMPPTPSFRDFRPPAVDPRELDQFTKIFNASLIPFSGKWMHLEGVEGQRDYTDLDRYVDWCTKHGIAMEYHFLSGYLPDWLLRRPAEEQARRFLDHAKEVVARYGDRIAYWQVVNEGQLLAHAPPVFQAIREMNPKLKLGISHCARFELMEPQGRGRRQPRPPSEQPGLEQLRALKAQGVQVDFFGFHGHRPFGLWPDVQKMYAAFDQFAAEGVKIHVTEFLAPVPPGRPQPIVGSVRGGTWTEELQAEFYERIYTICYSHPAVELVNLWGIGPNTWQPGSGLLDADYQPKPAFDRLRDLIQKKFRTTATGRLDLEGTFRFTGFHGTYEVEVDVAGQRTRGTFEITPATRELRLQLNAGGLQPGPT